MTAFLISAFTFDFAFCKACCYGKQHSFKFNKLVREIAIQVNFFTQIFVDLCRKIPLRGCKYYLLFKAALVIATYILFVTSTKNT